jgi:thiamine pyrophosphokinase
MDSTHEFRSCGDLPGKLEIETDGVKYDVTNIVSKFMDQCVNEYKEIRCGARVNRSEVFTVNKIVGDLSEPPVHVKIEISIEGAINEN